MSKVRADQFSDREGSGAPTFPYGAIVAGVVTATSFEGDGSQLTGIAANVTSLKDSGGTVRVQANTDGAVVAGVVTATSFEGDGSQLTGIDATSLKDSGGTVRVQANTDGAVITGVVTATSFQGDGSQLTGIDATSLKDSGGTVRVQANTDGAVITGVTTSTGGFVGNITGDLTGNITGNITGTAATFTGNVSVGGTLSYEDVTNIDSVGVVTARTGIDVTGGNIDLIDDSKILLGTGDDLEIYHSGSHSFIVDSGVGSLYIRTSAGNIQDQGNANQSWLQFNSGAGVEAHFAGNKKLETTTSGVTVTGDVTATSFIGNVDTSSSWTLGANGSSDYTFTGPGFTGAENDPTLYLIRGQTYKFVNNMGAHAFRIQSDPNGSTGTQYNDGITNNDVTNGTLTWDVQFDAPDTLYYQCTAHPNMGGIIYIGSESREIPEVSKSSGYTLITSDTGKFINITSGNITVPSGTFSPGALITIYNNKSSTMSITASGTTLRKAGTSSTGTCTVAERGTASILCVGSNEFVVAGNIT